MLDVHILHYRPHPQWWPQCLASVENAVMRAGFAVAVHVVQGEPDHLGRGRAKGYACGSYPYVTHVDNDDYVLPSAFAVLASALARSPDAIFTGEMQCDAKGVLRPGASGLRHHLAVFRRDRVMDHSRYALAGDRYQIAAVADAVCIDLPDRVYCWRVWDSPCRELRRRIGHVEAL
jgi:hypothetical protein